MAVESPYATAAEYRARTSQSGTGDDATILLQTTAVSRYLDARLRRFYTQDAAVVTRIYDGNGEQRLWLPDDIAMTTGLVVTADQDGDYDFSDETALTLNTDYWVGPWNAGYGSEPRPYTFLEVSPNSANLSAWPEQLRSVQVVAKFGWPAVPAAIKEITVAITRQLRDLEKSGVTQAIQNIDTVIQQSPELAGLMARIERMYARPPRF